MMGSAIDARPRQTNYVLHEHTSTNTQPMMGTLVCVH